VALISLEGTVNWGLVLTLYAASHGFIVACGNALFWDDWSVYQAGSTGVKRFFRDSEFNGLPFREHIEGLLILPGPWLMRLMTFLVFPLATFFLFGYLQKVNWTTRAESAAISICFLFLPIYGARVANINFSSTLSLLLFVIGIRLGFAGHAWQRILGVIPLFWSLFMPSLQFFVIVPFMILLILLFNGEIEMGIDRLVGLTVMIISPFVHRYLIPNLFPSLRVENYNQIYVAALVRACVVVFLTIIPITLIILRYVRGHTSSREAVMFCLGLVVLGLGSFPYLAVGHFATMSDWVLPILPRVSDWSSRHQILQSFGLALMVTAVGHRLFRNLSVALSVTLLVVIPLNIATYSAYYLDQLKQAEVIAALSTQKETLKNTEALLVEDRASHYNARSRGPRPAELVGMVNQAINRKVRVDGNLLSACLDLRPSHLIVISASKGRLMALLTRDLGVTVQVEPAPRCFRSSNKQIP